MDFDDVITDGFGIALGLGEEIAIGEKADKMTQQESDGVLGAPVSERNLVPINLSRGHGLVDLSHVSNWIVPGTKRLRSPFIEKWRRVLLGQKDPNDPLLTYVEEIAYELAQTTGLDEEAKKTSVNLQKLKKLNLQLKIQEIGKKIRERRYPHVKDQDNG